MAKAYVSVGDLAEALGLTEKQVRRGADVGRFPGAHRGQNAGSHRRWPVAAAAEIVRSWGRVVPSTWGESAKAAA